MVRPCGAHATLLLAGAALLTAHSARAQLLMRYLPQSVPGYLLDPALGVLQNGGPDYRSQGIRVGDFIIRPSIDETFGFNDNPLGLVAARSSPVIGSAGSVSVNSDWSRDSIAASLSANDLRYTALPLGDQTGYTAFAGGGIDLGRDRLDISGGHVSTYIAPTDVLSLGLAAPIPFSTNDARIAYTAPLARVSLAPSLDFTSYHFGQPSGGAGDFNETGQDKDQIAAGITASYALSQGHNLVAAFLQTNAYLLNRGPGNPLSRYSDTLLLTGLDYDTHAAFRYDVLLGYERRSFSGGALAERQTPAAEISVTWRPTLLTTVNAAGIRHLSDASAFVANDLVYNEGKLAVYHEVSHNVVLNGSVDFQSTAGSANEGGNRTSLTAGSGATYLLNRAMRLDLSYQFMQGSGFTSLPGIIAADSGQATKRSFQSNLIQWTLHFGF